MEPMGLSAFRVVKALGFGRTANGGDPGLRARDKSGNGPALEQLTGSSAAFWLGLQSSYDLNQVRLNPELGRKLKGIHPFAV